MRERGLVRKLLITTGITLVVFAAIYGVIVRGDFSLRELADCYRP